MSVIGQVMFSRMAASTLPAAGGYPPVYRKKPENHHFLTQKWLFFSIFFRCSIDKVAAHRYNKMSFVFVLEFDGLFRQIKKEAWYV
jgi:hypothetical protein